MDTDNKRYTVVISDEATQMLVSHARFLAQVSEHSAMRLIEAFQVKTKSLEQFPERNPWLVDPLLTRYHTSDFQNYFHHTLLVVNAS